MNKSTRNDTKNQGLLKIDVDAGTFEAGEWEAEQLFLLLATQPAPLDLDVRAHVGQAPLTDAVALRTEAHQLKDRGGQDGSDGGRRGCRRGGVTW